VGIEIIRKQVADSIIFKFGNYGIIPINERLYFNTYLSIWRYQKNPNIISARINNVFNPKDKIRIKIIYKRKD
jgi:hypothetical protein